MTAAIDPTRLAQMQRELLAMLSSTEPATLTATELRTFNQAEAILTAARPGARPVTFRRCADPFMVLVATRLPKRGAVFVFVDTGRLEVTEADDAFIDAATDAQRKGELA